MMKLNIAFLFATLLSLAAMPFAACGCGVLSTPNSICTLTSDLTTNGSCFIVTAPNVTIDCNGFSITGNGISAAPSPAAGGFETIADNYVDGSVVSTSVETDTCVHTLTSPINGTYMFYVDENGSVVPYDPVETYGCVPGSVTATNNGSVILTYVNGSFIPVSSTYDSVIPTLGFGIYSDAPGTTIKNCGISNFGGDGVRFQEVSNGKIMNTHASSTAVTSCSDYLIPPDLIPHAGASLGQYGNYCFIGFAIDIAGGSNNSILDSSGSSMASPGSRGAIRILFGSNDSIINSTDGTKLNFEHSSGINVFGGALDWIYSDGSSNGIISNLNAARGGVMIAGGSNNTISNSYADSSNPRLIYIVSNSPNITTEAEPHVPGISLTATNDNLIINSTGRSEFAAGIFMLDGSGNCSNNTVLNSTGISNSGVALLLSGTSNHIRTSAFISDSTAVALNGVGNIFTRNSVKGTIGIGLGPDSKDDVLMENNITSDIWVVTEHIPSTGSDSFFNNSSAGNIYYFANGTPSWEVYNITDTNGDNYADAGSDRPFNQFKTPDNWPGLFADWHPYAPGSKAGQEPQASVPQNATANVSAAISPSLQNTAAVANFTINSTAISAARNLAYDALVNTTTFTLKIENKGATPTGSVMVREEIPETVATSPDQLTFSLQPTRFEHGSIIAVWEFPNGLGAGETRTITYSVGKQVTSMSGFGTSIASYAPATTGTQPSTQQQQASNMQLLIAALVVVIGIVIASFFVLHYLQRTPGEDSTMKLFENETRASIMKQLSEADRIPTDLSLNTGVTKAAVVKQLDILINVGLVERIETPGKKFVYYRLTQKGRQVLLRMAG